MIGAIASVVAAMALVAPLEIASEPVAAQTRESDVANRAVRESVTGLRKRPRGCLHTSKELS